LNLKQFDRIIVPTTRNCSGTKMIVPPYMII